MTKPCLNNDIRIIAATGRVAVHFAPFKGEARLITPEIWRRARDRRGRVLLRPVSLVEPFAISWLSGAGKFATRWRRP